MLVPVLISRSSIVDRSKGNKSLVSTSFIATFSDGSQKLLNHKKWLINDLIKESDFHETVISKDTCSLYWKDWSNNPLLGSWDKNYPSTNIIQTEILNSI